MVQIQAPIAAGRGFPSTQPNRTLVGLGSLGLLQVLGVCWQFFCFCCFWLLLWKEFYTVVGQGKIERGRPSRMLWRIPVIVYGWFVLVWDVPRLPPFGILEKGEAVSGLLAFPPWVFPVPLWGNAAVFPLFYPPAPFLYSWCVETWPFFCLLILSWNLIFQSPQESAPLLPLPHNELSAFIS